MAPDDFLDRAAQPGPQQRYVGYSFACGQPHSGLAVGHGGVVGPQDETHITADTLFDLASLTKLYTATLGSLLFVAGHIDPHAPLAEWVDVTGPLGELTAFTLLTHTSGLAPEWTEVPGSPEDTLDALWRVIPDHMTVGAVVYSCTGYSLFGSALERTLGTTLDALMKTYLFEPLGLTQTMFTPDPALHSIAESREPTSHLKPGTVHDPRARALGGVSGNAGLFASATDVATFLLEVASSNEGVVSRHVGELLFTPVATSEWKQAVGFRVDDVKRLGKASAYHSHTGFTGTLAMVSPTSGHVATLLTNRLSAGTDRAQLAAVYRGFAERVAKKT